MADLYKCLPGFAKFLLEENLENVSRLFLDKIKEAGSFDIFPALEHLPDAEQLQFIKDNYKKFLASIYEGDGKQFIVYLVDHWKENKLAILSGDPSAINNLLKIFKIRKYTFYSFLPSYTTNQSQQIDIIIEFDDLYNFYIGKLIQVVLDVHHEKIIEEKEFSQSIINNVVSGISAFDLEGNVTEWNRSMEKTYQVSKEQILGKKLSEFFDGYEISEEARLFERAVRGETIYLNDRKYRLRKGWFEAHFVPLTNSQKEVIGVLSISNDITQRKENELKIQEDQHFIQSIADTSPDVITVYDLEERRNIYSSKEIYDILGYSYEELEALKAKGVQGLVEAIHPEDLPKVLEFLESYKTYNGASPRDLEYRIKDSTGEYRWIMDRYNVFKRSEDGHVTQIIGIARDNTVRKMVEDEIKGTNTQLKEANEELNRTQELLKDANTKLEDRVQQRTTELIEKNKLLSRINADLDNFIYTASHDLKSPAVNLEGLMTVLMKKIRSKIDDNDKKIIDMIDVSIKKLHKTILDLTEITKVQKEIGATVESILISGILDDVKSDIQNLIIESNAEIIEEIQADRITYNKSNLRSIIYNLLSNAIKYRSPGRPLKIVVRTYIQENQVVLCIEDNGLGLDETQVPKLFTMFKRLHSHVEGTGIGLYIIKRIIENNGGNIEVESKVGQGTMFKVTFAPEALPVEV